MANLREAARSILAEEGRVSEATLNRIAGTLQAAAVSSEGRELLARGRLTGDLEATGFELLAPLAEATQKPRSRRTTRGKTAADRKGEEDARKRLDAARDRLREARGTAKAAEKDLRTAGREADKARRELARAEEAAAEARKRVEGAEKSLREAERKARRKAR